MLLNSSTPYDTLPKVLQLGWDDFDCGFSHTNEKALDEVADWVVLAYMAADCNLAPYMFDDLLAMKKVGSTERVHVLAWFDGPLLTDAFFARLNAGTTLADDVIFRYNELHVNEAATLTMALQVASAYRAKHKLLLLGGHGSGWRGALIDENAGMHYTKEPGKLLLPGPGAACDARLKDCMLKAQDRLHAALEKVDFAGARFDVLGLDACYMGSVEAVAHLAGQADLMVVSEDMVPGEGFAYGSILSDLVENPDRTPAELASGIVKRTQAFYADAGAANREITLAVLATAELAPFSESFVGLVQQLDLSGDAALLKTVQTAFDNVWRFDETGTVDLRGFLEQLLKGDLPEATKSAVLEVLASWSRLVIAFSGKERADGANGLSLYAPPPDQFDMNYIDLSNGLPLNLGIWALFLGQFYLQTLGAEAPEHPLIQALQQTMEKLIADGEYKPGDGAKAKNSQ